MDSRAPQISSAPKGPREPGNASLSALPSRPRPTWTGPIHGEVFHGRRSRRLLHSVASETGLILTGVRDATARIARPHRRRSRLAAGGAGAAGAQGLAHRVSGGRGATDPIGIERLWRLPARDARAWLRGRQGFRDGMALCRNT